MHIESNGKDHSVKREKKRIICSSIHVDVW